jgi:hypothetical protein
MVAILTWNYHPSKLLLSGSTLSFGSKVQVNYHCELIMHGIAVCQGECKECEHNLNQYHHKPCYLRSGAPKLVPQEVFFTKGKCRRNLTLTELQTFQLNKQ